MAETEFLQQVAWAGAAIGSVVAGASAGLAALNYRQSRLLAEEQRGYSTYAFARALGRSPPYAYQVWRQDFDKMLYDHARDSGADAREGHEVVAVDQQGPCELRLRVDVAFQNT